MVKVGKTEIDYFCDYLARVIHIMDRNSYATQSLTNAIDPNWQKEFVYQEKLLKDVLDFDWYCYGTDGIVCKYSNWNFKYIADHSFLHQPFVDVMSKRKEGPKK